MDVEKIIADTVNQTVLKLKLAGLMKDNNKTAFQKTEELLRNYNALSMSTERKAKHILRKINQSLEVIKDDPYYEIISLYYVDNQTREEIAEHFDTSVTTVSRNKTRLVNKLKAALFADEFITELYS